MYNYFIQQIQCFREILYILLCIKISIVCCKYLSGWEEVFFVIYWKIILQLKAFHMSIFICGNINILNLVCLCGSLPFVLLETTEYFVRKQLQLQTSSFFFPLILLWRISSYILHPSRAVKRCIGHSQGSLPIFLSSVKDLLAIK